MHETAFTAAPWSICWTIENDERTGGHIVGNDGKGSSAPICNVPFFPRVRDPGETQANLHLMAAAPDLLECLSECVFWIDALQEQVADTGEYSERVGFMLLAAAEAARAAIARAGKP